MHCKKYFLDKGEFRIRSILHAIRKDFTDEAILDMSVEKVRRKFQIEINNLTGQEYKVFKLLSCVLVQQTLQRTYRGFRFKCHFDLFFFL